MARPAKKTPENFITGKVDAVSVGAYGRTVRVFVEGDCIKLSYQDPKTKRPRQQTPFKSDTPVLREKALAVAAKISDRLKEQKAAAEEMRADGGREWPPRVEELTILDAAKLYMLRVPSFPVDMLERDSGGFAALKRWHAELPEEIRSAETTPAYSTLEKDVTSFRALFRHPLFPRDRLVEEVEPGDATKYSADWVLSGRSPRTSSNHTDRLSSAFRYVMQQHRRSVGLKYNPIDGRRVDRNKARIPPFTPEELQKLRKAAWENRKKRWRVYVYVGLSSSGRRSGAMLNLSTTDHDFTPKDGAPYGTVRWRARFAKGENYGRGDSIRPMTRLHRRVVEWAIQHHPNPAGPEHPILWMPHDPTRHIEAQLLGRDLRKLHRLAGVEYIKGRGIHSSRRAVVTQVADQLGDGAAAEFVDMTVKTVRNFNYKVTVDATMGRAADVASDLAGEDEEEES